MSSSIRFTTDAATPTLQVSLQAYWKLTEVGGTRFDLVGSNHLTDNATVTQARGRGIYAFPLQAQFTNANSEYLSISDNTALSTGNIDFTIAAWVYLDSTGADRVIAAKGAAAGSTLEWRLLYSTGSDRFRFSISSGGTANNANINANNLGSPSTATWYFIVAWFDSVAKTVNISVNNGTANSADAGTDAPVDRAGAFNIGAEGGAFFFDGRIAGVGFWKKVPTATERTNLYNGGNGSAPKSTSFSPDAGNNLSTDLISYWKLDEASGTRLDSYSGNDLTDNATVTQNPGRAGIGYAGQFTAANSEYLSIADNAELSTGNTSFTFTLWAYLDTNTGTYAPISKRGGVDGSEYLLEIDSKRATFYVYTDQATKSVTANNFGDISTGIWVFIVATYDLTNNVITIQINNGTANSASIGSAIPTDTNGTFYIGQLGNGSEFMSGRIDEVGFWKRVLTAQERTDLYNSGNGTTIKSRFNQDTNGNLGDRLIAQWNLNEASGTRVDSISAENLTDNNTVTQAAGKIDNAGQFTAANSEYLSRADDADLSTGDIDFAFCAWVYFDSLPTGGALQTIAGKYGDATADQEWFLGVYESSGTYVWNFLQKKSGGGSYSIDQALTTATGTWYFVVVWRDATADTINLQVDNGTVYTVSSVTVGSDDSTTAFLIGALTFGGISRFWDGRIDEVGFWKRVLTSQERTDLYNGASADTVGMEVAQLTSDVDATLKYKMFALFD